MNGKKLITFNTLGNFNETFFLPGKWWIAGIDFKPAIVEPVKKIAQIFYRLHC